MIPLSPKRRSELRAEAHKLRPIVLIGDKGLTEEVVAEIDRSLRAHELIKVRAATGEREARDGWVDAICTRLEAHAVQQIGKVFVLYRENPEEMPSARAEPAQKPARRATRVVVVSDLGKKRQLARDLEKRKARDILDMMRKGKIKAKPGTKLGPRPRGDDGSGDAAATGTSRPRSRTPSPLPESGPRRRRPRTSR